MSACQKDIPLGREQKKSLHNLSDILSLAQGCSESEITPCALKQKEERPSLGRTNKKQRL